MGFKLPSLLPKADRFCALLTDLTEQASVCADHLNAFVATADPTVRSRESQAIDGARAKAKTISTEITAELCKSFITPFDREDIQNFAADLYKIPKTIDKVKERINLHDIKDDAGDFARQADLIAQEAAVMKELVGYLVRGEHTRKAQDCVAALYDLEHTGDKVLGELLVSLFSGSKSAADLILRKDVYDMLEKVIDRYRDAGGVALQMMLKHS